MMVFVSAELTASTNSSWVSRVWQADEGLPENTVVSLGQTSDGFLVAATYSGLVRFDGMQFMPFARGIMSGSPASVINAILIDGRDRLWVSRFKGGIVCVDHGRVATILSPEKGRLYPWPPQMLEDREGAVWICHGNGEVLQIKNGRERRLGVQDGLPAGGYCRLAVDGKGQLWFAQEEMVGVFRDGSFHQLVKVPVLLIAGARSGGIWICGINQLSKYTEDGSLLKITDLPTMEAGDAVIVLHEDKAGVLWIGTRFSGLFCYDGTSFAAVKTSVQTIISGIEDRDGNFWVGTRGGGLNQLKKRLIGLHTINSSMPYKAVQSVCQDTDGVLWAVVWQEGVVMRNTGDGWKPLSAADGWSINFAHCVTADPGGGVWIGTDGKGLHHWRNGAVTASFSVTNGLESWITAMFTARSGEIWIGSGSFAGQKHKIHCLKDGKVETFELPSGSGPVVALAACSPGECWMSTHAGLLLRIHDGSLTDETMVTGMARCGIWSLLATPDGSLWIGISGQGLGRLKAGRFTQCRVEQGLYDDYISQIIQDGNGRFWFAGNRGIFSVREKDLNDFMDGRISRVQSVAFGQKEGLPVLQASIDSWPRAFRGADGRLYFAMQSGVAVVNASDFKDNQNPPNVVIEKVSVNGKILATYMPDVLAAGTNSAMLLDLRSGAHLRLLPGQRQVEFVFTAPGFKRPESITFKYRLKGMDVDWIDAGVQRMVTYAQVPPGEYSFQVIARNSDGVWNEKGVTLSLTVEPYWWETIWFRVAGPLFAVVLLLGGVFLVLKRRHQHQIERLEMQQATEQERARIAADLHDDLGASLTRISVLADSDVASLQEAKGLRGSLVAIGTMARDMTRAMDEIVWAVNPRNDTLESIVHYLSDYAEDFLLPAGLRLRLDIPLQLPAWSLPSVVRHNLFLAFKEVLNNIVKHARAREVHVGLKIDPLQFRLSVCDDGCGLPAEPEPAATGNGLRNMRERMGQLGGECRLSSMPGKGTTVEFVVPVSKTFRRDSDES